jgi:membrane-associated protease RseP (regulator of RpoE activity)
MSFWQKTALSAALVGAVGFGAAVAPTVSGQSRVRVVEPSDVQVFSLGGGRLGVTISDVDATDANAASGVRIDEVEEGSPAEKAGFQKGDVVTEFDGERVRSARQFSRLVSETPPGRQVSAIVSRNGQRSTVTVTPRESSSYSFLNSENRRALETLQDRLRVMPTPAPPRAPNPPRAPRAPEPPAIERFFYSGSTLGVTTNSLSEQLQEYFGAKGGLLVTSVTEDSAAAKAGVKAGDVIVSVNGRSVDEPFGLRSEVQRLDPGEEFTLEIVRDRKAMTLKGKMEERSSRRRTIL